MIWIFEGKIIQRNFTNIFNEINHALLILGPKLNINLLDLISSIYTKDKFADPRTIQERLAQFGFIVDRNEIMRVSLSFILRNKNPDEKRKIVSRIIGSSTENFENYKSIPDDKRMDIEMLFLNDYIDNPFAEVQIISLN